MSSGVSGIFDKSLDFHETSASDEKNFSMLKELLHKTFYIQQVTFSFHFYDHFELISNLKF